MGDLSINIKQNYAKTVLESLSEQLDGKISKVPELSGEINELQEQLALAKRELTITTFEKDMGRIQSQEYMEKVKEEKNNFMVEISQMEKELEISKWTIGTLRTELDNYMKLTTGFLSEIQEMKEENEILGKDRNKIASEKDEIERDRDELESDRDELATDAQGLLADGGNFVQKTRDDKEQIRIKIRQILSKFSKLYEQFAEVPISNPKEYADDKKYKNVTSSTLFPKATSPRGGEGGFGISESKKLNKNNLKKIILEELKRIK